MCGAAAKGKQKTGDRTSTTSDAADLIAELNDHIFQGRIFDARVSALELKKLKNESSEGASTISEIDSVEHIIEEVLDQAEHVENLLHDLHSDDDWILAKESKGVTIHYRREVGTHIHTVRAQTQLNFEPKDFTKLCSLFVETEYMPNWFPGGVMKKANVLSWHSKYSKVVQLHISLDLLPFLAPRDAIVYGNGYHLPDSNAFLIRSKSTLENTCRYCDIPKPAKGVVRMDTESIFFVQLIKRDVISFKMIGRDDLKLRFIPSPLLNHISQGVLPYELMRTVKRTIRNFEGSVWDKKMKERGAYYQEIENKVHAQLEKWDKEGSDGATEFSFMSKNATKDTETLSSKTTILSSFFIVLAAIMMSIYFTHSSMSLKDILPTPKLLVKLLENEDFRRLVSPMLTLIMTLASIQKLIKLASSDIALSA